MGKVYAGASTSIDGYISGPNTTGFEYLFEWLQNGPNEVATANPDMTMRLSDASVPQFRAFLDDVGALVVGRRLFDYTNGWGGLHTSGHHVFVVTHSVPDGWADAENFTFVTEGGVPAAIEQAKAHAGDKGVALNGGEMASQALDAGLVDELWVDLVPVVLGAGVPLLAGLSTVPVALENPEIIAGDRVTHLRYPVRRPA